MLNKPNKKNKIKKKNNNQIMSLMNYVVSDDDDESRSETWEFPTTIEDSTTGNSMLLMRMDSNHSNNNNNNHEDEDDMLAPNHDGFQSGVLIVDGQEDDDEAANDEIITTTTTTEGREGGGGSEDDVLSYPESIPTEIGSLLDHHHHHEDVRDDDDDVAAAEKRRRRYAIGLLVGGSILLLIFMSLSFVLVWDRQGLLQRNSALEDQLVKLQDTIKKEQEERQQQLEVAQQQQQKTQSLKAKAALDWENEDFFTNTKILLADNCWIKAEVELRECVDNAKDSLDEFSTGAYKVFKDLFYTSETEQKKDGYDSTKKDSEDHYDFGLQLAGWSWTSWSKAADVVASAAVNVLDSMTSISQTMDESVIYAVQQTRDAVQDATDYTRKL